MQISNPGLCPELYVYIEPTAKWTSPRTIQVQSVQNWIRCLAHKLSSALVASLPKHGITVNPFFLTRNTAGILDISFIFYMPRGTKFSRFSLLSISLFPLPAF